MTVALERRSSPRSASAHAVAAAFALAVALEATLFGVYAPVDEPVHNSHHVAASGDAGALVVLVALFVSAAGIAFPFFLRTLESARGSGAARGRQFGYVAPALCSTSAALIHFAVLPEHVHEFWLFGVLFALIATLQLAWAGILLLRPSPALLLAGAAGNLGVVAVWLLSRTTGLPVGPEPWSPEHIGVADALATGLELLLVAASVTALRWGGVARARVAGLATWTLVCGLVAVTAVALLSAAGAAF